MGADPGTEAGESRAWWREYAPLATLAAAVLLSFGLSLGGGFVWDDAPLIEENRRVQDPSALGEILTSSFWETGDRHDRFRSFFRPAVSLSYAADFRVWGLRPFGFHLTNVLLHLGCCWLVYGIARGERLARSAALGAGLVFALHPVHVESVAWISGRTDLLCAAFMLGAFALWRGAAGRDGTFPARRVVSWALFALALFSKEMAATLPALVFLDAWRRAPDGGRARRACAAALPYAATLASYLLVRASVVGALGSSAYALPPLAWLATALFVAARYLTLLLLPVGLDAHHPYAPFEGLAAAPVLVAAAMIGLALWALGRAPARSPVRFWGSWTLISLLPVMTFGRFGDVVMADRFLYIPSVGLALLAGRGWDAWTRSGLAARGARRAALVAASLVLAILAGSTIRRSRVWRDDLTLFNDMLARSPHSALVRNNLGLALYEGGDLGRAEEEFRQAVELAPSYALAHNNLAAVLERTGRPDDALAHYREALRLAPRLSEAGANAGHLLVVLGRAEEGIRLLDELERLYPRSVAVLYARAEALDRVGRRAEAEALAARVLEVDSRNAAAHYLLGKIRFDRGEREAAAAAMRRFLELWAEPDGEHAAAARRIVAAAASGTGTAPGSPGS
jgi:tetratricopeptide (TPR) repeat protein